MPKDNEVDEKAVAWMNPESRDVINAERKHAWLHYFGSPGEKQAAAYTEPLTYAATVDELRAEVERWKSRYDDAMQARADEQKRADAAERRVGELTSLLSDTVGNLHRMGNNEFADCDQERLDIVISRIERTLTGADPT